jgi:hypothetical protein
MHRTPREARRFTDATSLSLDNRIPGSPLLTKKRELFPGSTLASPPSVALPHWGPRARSPPSGSGILTRFPFDRIGVTSGRAQFSRDARAGCTNFGCVIVAALAMRIYWFGKSPAVSWFRAAGRARSSVMILTRAPSVREPVSSVVCVLLASREPLPRSERSSPISQGRLTHVQLLFTWNPSPLRSTKFSFVYLLLPPRSALPAAPRVVAHYASAPPARPSTRRGLAFRTRCPDGPV